MSTSLNYELHTLINRLDLHAQAFLQERFSISYSRFLMLRAVGSVSSPTQHQIAQSLQISDPSASRMLGLLEADGYIITAVSDKHKRRNAVSLTAKGRKIAHEAELHLAERFERLLVRADVSTSALDTAVDSLNTALDNAKRSQAS